MAASPARDYYRSMLNAMQGLRDDLDANQAPEAAHALLAELIEECRSDFRISFGPEIAGPS